EVHADKHVLAYQSSSTLFEGNDGGIYKTTNGGSSWIDLSNGLVISQIYRIGISKTDNTKILAGLQDNGTKKYSGGISTWTDVYGGDGMECIIDNNNATSYMYVTYTNGQIYRNSNGFSTYSTTKISDNITGLPSGAWVTPYIMDPSNSANLYAGYDMVWKTTNRGDSWTAVSQQLSASAKLRSVAIAPSNTDVLYAADQLNMWKTTDGGATNWTAVTLPSNTNSLTYVAVKNNAPNTLWITYGGFTDGGKIYESTDGGSSWTNISSGLPNLPVMCVTQYTRATDRTVLFAGTDVGVYVKDGSNNWAAFNTGLPNVVVSELEVFYGSGTDKLRAGTFGRGLWETEISSALPVELTSFKGSQDGNTIILNWKTATELHNYGFSIERKSADTLSPENVWKSISFVAGKGSTNTPQEYAYTDNGLSGTGTYIYRLKQIDNNGAFHYSGLITVEYNLPLVFELLQNYPNPFNPSTVIRYAIPTEQKVTLTVFDVLGNTVQTLVNEVQPAGKYRVAFNGSAIANGVYFYKIQSGKFAMTRKLVVLK
ncbi:MAG: T9SS type A sorting domain-containing protein, partial [Ignavibacteriales bacterium]|nr:T9SS type A sorting domain-containing protein [Ignavibacteriales bacterium]